MEDLITIHHEMGHIEYFLQYKEQPLVYRDGANPGEHKTRHQLLAALYHSCTCISFNTFNTRKIA